MPTAIAHAPPFTVPGSSTSTALVRWNGTGGNQIQDSTILVGATTMGLAADTDLITFGNATLAITGAVTGVTSLQVDNLNINGNTISSTAGTDLLITPLGGQQIVLDGTIIIDAGVVTGATSITSTQFVGGGVGLTGLAAANITASGTLPALNGAALTALNGTQITSGTLPAARIGDDSIVEAKLDVSNGPTNGQFLQAQSGEGGGLTWAAAGGALDSALTDFISDGDYRSIYMLGAWPQNGNPGDDAIRGYGGQFKADINGGNSGISRSNDGGAWQLTSGNSDQHSCGLFAGDAILAASDDFTITCRFNKESASLFSFGMAADVQGYRPEAQNDAIAFYFGNSDEVSCYTDNAGTSNEETVTANGISGEHYATIIVSGNGTSVAFWVDGVLKTTHTTNIPTATDLYLFFQVSSYGSAYRTCNVMDFFAYREV